MQDGCATESCRRQEDYTKTEEAMTTKMEEGFRNEQHAREQAQKEIMDGLENEEKPPTDGTDRLTSKDKIRHLESGSGIGGTAGSEVRTAAGRGPSGTFARPPLSGSTTYLCHDEWSSKVGSRTTSGAGTKGSQTQKF